MKNTYRTLRDQLPEDDDERIIFLKKILADEKAAIEFIESSLTALGGQRETSLVFKEVIPEDAPEGLIPVYRLFFLLRAVLCIRGHELAYDALHAFKNNRKISAVVLTRALLESGALLADAHDCVSEVEKSHNTADIKNLQERLNCYVVGSKDDTTPYDAKNILSAIDNIEKHYPELRKMYGGLSEYAHPNWRGALGAYGAFDVVAETVNIDWTARKVPAGIILAPLLFGIALLIDHVGEAGAKS